MCIIDKIFSMLTISVVKIYKFFISPLLGNNCRFLPTCSEYCIEALEKKGFFVGIFLTNNCRYLPTCSEYFIDSLKEYGTIKGTLKGFKRILKCHPIKFLGAKSGFDPVEKDKLNG